MFLFHFLIIELYFLIPADIVQVFNHTTELIMLMGTLTKDVKTEIETHPGITEAKIK